MNAFQKFLIKLATIIYPCKVFGKENVPSGKIVICCNHFSFIDPVYIASFVQDDIHILAKKEAFNCKLMGKIYSSFGAIPVDRQNMDMPAMIKIIKILKNGGKMIIFPEGTRNKTGSQEMLPFKGGSMVLATRSDTKILPMMLEHKARIFRNNYLLVGKPISLEQFNHKNLSSEEIEKMEEIVADEMRKLQKELKEIVLNKKNKKKTK